MRRVSAMVRRLLDHWSQADRDAHTQGRQWYAVARRTCGVMARERGVSLATACGVVAALSPRLQWGPNLRAARAVLAGERPTGVFRASLERARRIYQGARPLAVLSGPKVRAFYRALMGDATAAVVDVWVARAAGWVRELKEAAYAKVAAALATAARAVGVPVAWFQAVVWVAVRGRAA
jgi:hypothetical protein